MPGFIDPGTFQFVSMRTSDQVQKTTHGYLGSFFNTYQTKQSQYKRFLAGEKGEAEAEVSQEAIEIERTAVGISCSSNPSRRQR